MLTQSISTNWFRLRLRWTFKRIRRPSLPITAHLRRDLNLPEPARSPHWRDLILR